MESPMIATGFAIVEIAPATFARFAPSAVAVIAGVMLAAAVMVLVAEVLVVVTVLLVVLVRCWCRCYIMWCWCRCS